MLFFFFCAHFSGNKCASDKVTVKTLPCTVSSTSGGSVTCEPAANATCRCSATDVVPPSTESSGSRSNTDGNFLSLILVAMGIAMLSYM